MAVGQTDETENKMEDTIFCNTPPFLLLTSILITIILYRINLAESAIIHLGKSCRNEETYENPITKPDKKIPEPQ